MKSLQIDTFLIHPMNMLFQKNRSKNIYGIDKCTVFTNSYNSKLACTYNRKQNQSHSQIHRPAWNQFRRFSHNWNVCPSQSNTHPFCVHLLNVLANLIILSASNNTESVLQLTILYIFLPKKYRKCGEKCADSIWAWSWVVPDR